MRIRNGSIGALQSTVCVFGVLLLLAGVAQGSIGDHLPEFRECVKVCKEENCRKGDSVLPIHLRLLFWNCASECDYTCQHIITNKRLARDPPYLDPIVQYHGKWPFIRLFGVQEPCSVVFSLLNFLAHQHGLAKIRASMPASYTLRKYYIAFGYFGMVSWVFSMIFHTRDFNWTEKLDYFAAGASVLYGLFYTPIRVFRLDQNNPPAKQAILQFWTGICIALFIAHVSYLTLWRWDYTYNMAANVAAGVVQNLLWSGFSILRYRRLKKPWAAWPGLIVAWIVVAMSMELLDFPPWRGMVDAHSLWHLGTVVPTVWWYNFLVKDSQEDLASVRLKA